MPPEWDTTATPRFWLGLGRLRQKVGDLQQFVVVLDPDHAVLRENLASYTASDARQGRRVGPAPPARPGRTCRS